MTIDFMFNSLLLHSFTTVSLGVIISTFVTGIIISVSLSVISMGISYAIQRFMQKPVKAGERNFEVQLTDTKTYVPIVYGTTRIGTERIYAKGVGKDSKLLYVVLSCCLGEIDGFEGIWIDDKRIIDYTEYGSEEHNSEAAQSAIDHAWKNKVHFWFRRGNDDHNIVQVLQDAVGKEEWDDNAKGLGIAYVVIELGFDLDLFSAGLPDFLFKIRGKRVYDPRDGSQSGTDRTTWKYKGGSASRQGENPSLCILDYLCGGLEDNGSVRYGLGADITTEIDTASFIAAANYCDEIVTVGTIDPPTSCAVALVNSKRAKTYEISGSTITLEDNPRDKTVKIKVVETEGDGSVSYRQLYEETDYTLSGSTVTFTSGWSAGQKFTIEYSISVGGNLNANKYYKYAVTFTTSTGETSGGSKSNTIKTTSTVKKIKLTDIPIGNAENITRRKIYRSVKSNDGTTWGDYQLCGILNNNTTTTFTDNTATESLPISDGVWATTLPSSNSATITLKRYTCAGVIDNSQELMHNIEQLETSCRGKVVYESGLYSLRIKRATMPETFELTESTIIGDWKWETKGVSNSCNVIEAAYVDPNKKYKTQYVTWPKNAATNVYLGDDNSYELPKKIELPFTDNRKRAKQIAQIIRKESRQMIVASCSCTEEALKLAIYSLVNVTHSTPAWTKKPFWVTQLSLSQEGKVVVGLEEYDATNYELENLNSDTLGSSDTDLPTPYDIPDQVTNVSFTEISYVNKGVTYWKLKVSYTNPTSSLWKQCDVYVKIGGYNYEYYTTVNKESEGGFFIENIEEGTEYNIKFLSVSNLGKSNNIDDEEVEIWTHTVDGQLGNPADVTGFIAKVKDSAVTLSWNKATETDFSYCAIRETDSGTDVTDDTSWDAATEVGISKTNSFITVNHKGGSFKFWIRAYDKKANHSVAVGTIATVIEEEESWTSVFTNNLSAGTHDGTEYSDSLGRILRMKQNALENGDFESSDMSAWTLGTSWQRLLVDGDYCIRVAGGGTYNVLSTNVVTVYSGKTYLFKAWVKCNVVGAAKIGVNLDGTTVYSTTHSGGGNWELLSVTRTCGTPIGTPVVQCYAGILWTHSQYAAFDDVGFAQHTGTYRTSYYDNGTSGNVTKVYKLDARYPHTVPQFPVIPGTVFVELGICQHGDDPTDLNNWTWHPGLESGNITATGRYRRFRVTFNNVWIDEQLYVQEYAGGVVTLYDAEVPAVESEWTEDAGAALIYPNTLDTKISVGSTSALASVYVKEYSGQSVPLGRWDTSAGTEVASVSNTGLIKTSGGIQANIGNNLVIKTGTENGRKISFLTGSAGTEKAYINDSTFYINSDLTVTGTFNIGAVLFSTIMSPSGSDLLIKTYNTEGGHKISFLTAGVERLYINDNATRIENNLNLNGYLNSPSGVDVTIKTWAEAGRKISFYTGGSSTERLKISDSGVDVLQNLTVNASLSSVSGTDLTLKTVDGEALRSIYIRTNSVNAIRIQQALITITGSSIATDSAIGSSPGVNLLLKTPDGDSDRTIQFYVNSSEKAYINNSGMRVNGVLSVNGSLYTPSGVNLVIKPYTEAGRKISFKTNDTERAYIDDDYVVAIKPITGASSENLIIQTYPDDASQKISFKTYGVEKMYITDEYIYVSRPVTGATGINLDLSTYPGQANNNISFKTGNPSAERLVISDAFIITSRPIISSPNTNLVLEAYNFGGGKISFKAGGTEKFYISDTLTTFVTAANFEDNINVGGHINGVSGHSFNISTYDADNTLSINFKVNSSVKGYFTNTGFILNVPLKLNNPEITTLSSGHDLTLQPYTEAGRKIYLKTNATERVRVEDTLLYITGNTTISGNLDVVGAFTLAIISAPTGQNLMMKTYGTESGHNIEFWTAGSRRAYINDNATRIEQNLNLNGYLNSPSTVDVDIRTWPEAGRKISFRTGASSTERLYLSDASAFFSGQVTIGSNLFVNASILGGAGNSLTIATASGEAGLQLSFSTNSTVRGYFEDGHFALNVPLKLNNTAITTLSSGHDLTLQPYTEAGRKISFKTNATERMYVDDNAIVAIKPITGASSADLTIRTYPGQASRKIAFVTNNVERMYIDDNYVFVPGVLSAGSFSLSSLTVGVITTPPATDLTLSTNYPDGSRTIWFKIDNTNRAYINSSGMRVNGVLSVNGSITSPTSTTLLIQPSSGASLQLKAPDGESGQKISFYQNSSERAYIDNSNFRINTNISLNGELLAATGLTLNTRADSKISWWIGGVEKFYVDTSSVRYYNVSEVRFYSQAWLTGTPNLRINTEDSVQIWKDQTTQLVRISDSYFDIYLNTIRLRNPRTISSSSEFGNQGDICWNSSYLFICVSASSWKRIPLGW